MPRSNPKALGNYMNRYTCLEEERGVSVSRLMQRDPLNPGSSDVAVPACRCPIRVKRQAVFTKTTQAGVLVCSSPLETFGHLLRRPLLEGFDRDRIKVHGPPTTSGLGRTFHDLATLAGPLAGKSDGLCFEIDVGPSEADQFTTARPLISARRHRAKRRSSRTWRMKSAAWLSVHTLCSGLSEACGALWARSAGLRGMSRSSTASLSAR